MNRMRRSRERGSVNWPPFHLQLFAHTSILLSVPFRFRSLRTIWIALSHHHTPTLPHLHTYTSMEFFTFLLQDLCKPFTSLLLRIIEGRRGWCHLQSVWVVLLELSSVVPFTPSNRCRSYTYTHTTAMCALSLKIAFRLFHSSQLLFTWRFLARLSLMLIYHHFLHIYLHF